MSRYDDPNWKHDKEKDIWLWTNPTLNESKPRFANGDTKPLDYKDRSVTEILGIWRHR